jgi:hypothetical protein
MINFIPMLVSALRGFLSSAVSSIQSVANQVSGQITNKMSSSPNITAPPPNVETKFGVKGIDENIARLNRIEQQIKAGMNKITVAHSSALCYDLIRNTYPLVGGRLGSGASSGAQMVGERNFKAEVQKVFQPIDRIPFAELVKKQDWVGIQEMDWKPQVPSIIKMIEDRNDIGLLRVFGTRTSSSVQIIQDANPDDHRRARGKDGRAKGTVYVRNKQSIHTYAEMFKRRVGVMASGWWTCATRLGKPADGSASVASFVMKNYGTGRATVSSSGGKTRVEIENRLGDYNGMVTRIGGIANAVRSRTAKFNTAVAFMVRQVISSNK